MTKLAHIETRRVAIVATRAEPEFSLVPAAAPGQRAQQLFAEARSVSLEHLAALSAAIEVTRDLTLEIVDAADLYAPGLQHFAVRLGEELFWRGKTLAALAERQAAAVRPGRGAHAP